MAFENVVAFCGFHIQFSDKMNEIFSGKGGFPLPVYLFRNIFVILFCSLEMFASYLYKPVQIKSKIIFKKPNQTSNQQINRMQNQNLSFSRVNK